MISTQAAKRAGDDARLEAAVSAMLKAGGVIADVVILRLDTADAQTSILAEETTNTSLAEYVATGLAAGDRVELEWRQIRVETDTAVEEDRFLIAEQCIKLAKLDADAEAALLARWPEPQIMIRKPQGKAKAAAGGKAAAAAKKKEKKKGKKGKKKGKKGRRK